MRRLSRIFCRFVTFVLSFVASYSLFVAFALPFVALVLSLWRSGPTARRAVFYSIAHPLGGGEVVTLSPVASLAVGSTSPRRFPLTGKVSERSEDDRGIVFTSFGMTNNRYVYFVIPSAARNLNLTPTPPLVPRDTSPERGRRSRYTRSPVASPLRGKCPNAARTIGVFFYFIGKLTLTENIPSP